LFSVEQGAEQAPQLEMVVAMSASQPSFALALQSPQPVVHAGTHTPPTQAVVPCAFEHFTLHPPQLFGSVAVRVSHPLLRLPSQFEYPPAQTGAHSPLAHEVVPCWLVHASPQAPQLATVVTSVSQPSDGLVLQSFQPLAQVGAHEPELQATLPCGFTQTWPHAPQFETSPATQLSQPSSIAPDWGPLQSA
jgi:hypothetical protein